MSEREIRPTWLSNEDVSAALATLHVHACSVGAKYVVATYVPSSDVVSVHHNAPRLLSALAFVEQTIINVPTSLHYMNHAVDVGPIPSMARTFVLFPPMGIAEWHQAQADRDFAAEQDEDEDEDEDTDTPPPWKCERCSAGDNGTRYRNQWEVSLDGECNHERMPDVGVLDCGTHEIELCDSCARTPDASTWCLVYALRVHLASRDNELTADERGVRAALESLAFGKSGAL